MKKTYIDLAHKYLDLHPEFLDKPQELAFQLKLIGIPEKEIPDLVIEMTHRPPVSFDANKPPEYTIVSAQKAAASHTKLYIALYVIAMIAMISFIIFFPIKHKSQTISYVIPTQVQKNTKPFLPQIPSGNIVRQVYANELPVKMQQVFSYPVQNVQLTPLSRPKRTVVGFIPYWDLDSLDKLDTNEITTASLFGIEPDGNGDIIITDTQGNVDGGWGMWNDQRLDPFIANLKQKQIKVTLTIKMFSNTHIESLLSSSDAQKKLISNILYMVSSKNLDGVNLDFEYAGSGSSVLQDKFTNFVLSLQQALKNGFPSASLTVDTYASSGVTDDLFDLPRLASVVDAILIMGYDFHTPYTQPGPVAPLVGTESIASYIANYLQKIPANKIILGVPYYGYDWDITNLTPNSTTILSYADILGTTQQTSIQWDSLSETPWYSYNDSSGDTHKVYFDNVRSLGLKYDLVNRMNLQGVGIWALGYEGQDTQLDQLISQKFTR